MLRYNEKQLKQFAKEGDPRPIAEMCNGCCRIWMGGCMMITDPLHFYRNYGKCFARMDAATAEEVEMQIKAYGSPSKELRAEAPGRGCTGKHLKR